MDDADRANKDWEVYQKNISVNLKKEAEPTGYCLYCHEPLHDKRKRWCDAHCRDDWQRERNLKR